MDYQEWEQHVPADITGDVLCKMRAYRLALFLGDVAWNDVTMLAANRRTLGLLLTYIPDQRHVTLKEEAADYVVFPPDFLADVPMS